MHRYKNIYKQKSQMSSAATFNIDVCVHVNIWGIRKWKTMTPNSLQVSDQSNQQKVRDIKYFWLWEEYALQYIVLCTFYYI